MFEKRFVYVLRNSAEKQRYYTGVTSNVAARLRFHNAGLCQHTADGRPWQVDVVVQFADERRALVFEKYLKSGSGVAFAKRPGRLGPKLAPSKFDCQPYVAQRNVGRAIEEPVDANGVGWCNPLNENGPMVAGVMVARRAGPVSVLAPRLQPDVDRPTVDATGLPGNDEWDLRYAARPEAPVEVLVVDHVELPTPN